MADHDETISRLTRHGVSRRERDILTRYLVDPTTLRDTEAIRAVRAVLAASTVVLVALVGPRGVGKTVAAAFAILQRGERGGGAYLTAYQLARPGLDIDALKKPAVLVVDQLGREPIAASDYALGQLEELVDARYAERRLTLLVGNIDRATLDARYGSIVSDRLDGDGRYVELGGTSVRAACAGQLPSTVPLPRPSPTPAWQQPTNEELKTVAAMLAKSKGLRS